VPWCRTQSDLGVTLDAPQTGIGFGLAIGAPRAHSRLGVRDGTLGLRRWTIRWRRRYGLKRETGEPRTGRIAMPNLASVEGLARMISEAKRESRNEINGLCGCSDSLKPEGLLAKPADFVPRGRSRITNRNLGSSSVAGLDLALAIVKPLHRRRLAPPCILRLLAASLGNKGVHGAA